METKRIYVLHTKFGDTFGFYSLKDLKQWKQMEYEKAKSMAKGFFKVGTADEYWEGATLDAVPMVSLNKEVTNG